MPIIPKSNSKGSIEDNSKAININEYLNSQGITDNIIELPVWKGPCDSSDRGGVTFSLLNLFLSDHERFRLYVIEGLKSEIWDHKLFFGNCWHLCEEVYSNNNNGLTEQTWEGALYEYARKEADLHKFRGDEIQHWYRVCKVQFPIYLEYWGDNLEENSEILLSEYAFKVPYLVNSRPIYLRGKWDRIHLIDNWLWVEDHKSKGDIDEIKIQRQLRLDLQTMLYCIALKSYVDNAPNDHWYDKEVKGVKYNVIRRPLSGGTGTIRPHKAKVVKGTKKKPGYTIPAESMDHFYDRLANEVIRANPDQFFMRWESAVSADDIKRFKKICLDGILTQLCEWYDWVSSPEGLQDPFANPIHFTTPYGLYNALTENNPTDLDRCVESNSTVGLSRVTNLFPELQS